MFCPNCGSKNSVEQNYCRGCGLKLDAIVNAVSEQFPSKEFVDLQRRKEMFARIGLFCLAFAGFIGFALLLFQAALYKMILFGPEVLFSSAIGAVIGFLLLSVLFFNYPKIFMKPKNLPPDADPPAAVVTAKLIEDRPFDPVASVTENTTENLKVPRSR